MAVTAHTYPNFYLGARAEDHRPGDGQPRCGAYSVRDLRLERYITGA